jgi:hypothetical protein
VSDGGASAMGSCLTVPHPSFLIESL